MGDHPSLALAATGSYSTGLGREGWRGGSDVHVAKPQGKAEDPRRDAEAPSTLAPSLVGELPAHVASELDKLGVLRSEITPQQLSFPVYGNYCGFGYGDPTGDTPPIDAVDAVCREHDRCYALHGLFDRRCDRKLIEDMPSAIDETPSLIGKKAGLLALLYFSLAEQNLALGKTLLK